MMPLLPESHLRRRWFKAAPGFLVIDTDSAFDVPESLADAVLLDDHALLLHALALSLGQDHDWTPASASPDVSLTHTFQLVDQPATRIGVALHGLSGAVDKSLHESLSAWVSVTEHQQVVSFHFPVTALSFDEFEKLRHPGSLLLLEETFRGRVAGYVTPSPGSIPKVAGLCHHDESEPGERVSAVFDAGEFTVSVEPDRMMAEEKDAPMYACQVSAGSDTGIDLRKLQTTEQQPESLAINQYAHVSIALMEKGVCVDSVAGVLVTIGQGLGVRVVEAQSLDDLISHDGV